jgi:hypothetical protein
LLASGWSFGSKKVRCPWYLIPSCLGKICANLYGAEIQSAKKTQKESRKMRKKYIGLECWLYSAISAVDYWSSLFALEKILGTHFSSIEYHLMLARC